MRALLREAAGDAASALLGPGGAAVVCVPHQLEAVVGREGARAVSQNVPIRPTNPREL